jgi:hypothetical protein
MAGGKALTPKENNLHSWHWWENSWKNGYFFFMLGGHQERSLGKEKFVFAGWLNTGRLGATGCEF